MDIVAIINTLPLFENLGIFSFLVGGMIYLAWKGNKDRNHCQENIKILFEKVDIIQEVKEHLSVTSKFLEQNITAMKELREELRRDFRETIGGRRG